MYIGCFALKSCLREGSIKTRIETDLGIDVDLGADGLREGSIKTRIETV